MKKLNTLLQYRDEKYFLDRKPDELFVFEILNPILKVAKLTEYKSAHYFDYTGMVIKSVTTPSVALYELNGLRVYHRDLPQCTGTINGFYGLECTPYVGVLWDNGLGHLKLPATYFWNELYYLIIL
jgi:hypothetical protein